MSGQQIGAVVIRKGRGFTCYDEFDHEGRWIGGGGGNYATQSITNWRTNVEWPEEPVSLASLDVQHAVRVRRIGWRVWLRLRGRWRGFP